MKPSSSAPMLHRPGSGGLSASRSAAELIVGTSSGSRPSSGTRYKLSDGPSWIGPFCRRQTSKRNTFDVSLQPGLLNLEFNHSSSHGLHWDGLIVKRVTDQAQYQNVQPGWKIFMVDGVVVNDSQDIWQRLQAAKWEWRTCTVTFVTNIRAIRAEQALQKARELQAEEERLAKLPFLSDKDEKHLEQVKEAFTFQGYCDGVDNRGVTLEQLKRVLAWAKEKCHRWRDAQPVELSKTSGFKLHMDFLNMQHLYHWLIKPATQEHDCSMREMLSNEKQPPQWFCILWWGLPLKQFVRCVDAHIATRGLSAESTSFWLGSFANRPHSLSDGISATPANTWAYKGLAAANFKILLCLDAQKEHGTTQVFRRLWCCYEWQLALDNPNATLDLAIAEEPRPTMLTLNLTKEEEDMEFTAPGSGWKAKQEREKALNLAMFESLVKLQIENNLSTVSHEGMRILNCIAGRELQAKPSLPKHPNYDKTNQRLIAMGTLVIWRRIMSLASSDADALKLQMRAADAVRADVWRESIDLSLAFLTGCTDERIQLLIKSLPPGLKDCKIDLRNMGDVTNEHLAAIAAGLPKELESLTLNIECNELVDNLGVEALIAKLPPKVQMIHLGLKGTAVTPEMQQKKDSLQGMRQFIADEADKGNTCIILNLCPAATGRMSTTTTKCKVFPPQSDS
eukprot:TRINITY_DN73873_c0_g1_i1.p1 TRINITY_DN73873_c0_g1~~TRINITY_DN73873_c0_g1_i1.p1  ORF type:complete len:724 (+),score=183.94 TRINITY_DN73873_c0_g1_i1:139-2172(+)